MNDYQDLYILCYSFQYLFENNLEEANESGNDTYNNWLAQLI